MSLLPDGRALLTGGGDFNVVRSVVFASTLMFDPATNSWSAAAPMPNAHDEHAQVTLPDGRVLVFGGFASNDDLVNDAADDHVELYDPARGTWTPGATAPNFMARGTATLLNDGSVLIAGGSSSNTLRNVAMRYFPATNRWRDAGGFTDARREQAAALLPNGKVLIAGGDGDARGDAIASASLYDPAANRWTAVAPMATPREDATATTLPNGKVLVVGGESAPAAYLASAELFDAATNTWSPAPSMAQARAFHTATLLADGRVLVAGGDGLVQRVTGTLADAEIYTPDGWPFPRGGRAGGGGSGGGGAGSGTPAISKLALSVARFRAASSGPSATSARRPRARTPVGTTISYRDAAAATTTFTVQRPTAGRKSGRSCVKPTRANRRKARCTRWRAVGHFTHADAAGADRLHFSGRINGRKLPVGTYRLVVTARVGRGRASAAHTVGFAIVR